MDLDKIVFHQNISEKDKKNVSDILFSTKFFNQEELDVAVELVEEALVKWQEKSWYNFVFIDYEDKTIAYSCYGKIDWTVCSYDLYRIWTHNDFRWKWIGGILLKETEKIISSKWTCNIYIETAGREQYNPTRFFYENNNYFKEAVIKDFYADWDDKIIYSKRIG